MTTATVSVDRSTLRLSEVARHVVVPEGIERSLWLGWDGQLGVEDRVREFGITFDVWQDGLSQVALGVTDEGRFAATVGGITLSIPRQVAKTFITMVIVVALCTMFPNLTVLWTAHRSRLSTQTFGKMKALVRSKPLRKYLLPNDEGIRSTNGEQEIGFLNGSRIMFGAREHGFGLGFDEVDIEVFDEAQRVTSTALDDMVAATNQSRWIFGALLFFMGTPPRPTDAGEEFANRRKKALAVKKAAGIGDFGGVVAGGNAVFIECSADPEAGKPGGPSLDDRRQVAIANPSYPHRTPDISVQRLRENLTNDDSWRREGLGIWDSDDNSTRLITPDEWEATGTTAVPSGRPSLAVAFSRDGDRQAVAGSIKHDDGVHVELVGAHSGSTEAGVASLVSWLCEEKNGAPRWRRYAWIALCGKAGASTVHKELRDRGVPEKAIKVLTLAEYLAACSLFHEGIKTKAVTHSAIEGQKALDDSVAVCDRKFRGADGAWGWEPTTADGDETPIEAVSVANWAARTTKREPGRRQVLL